MATPIIPASDVASSAIFAERTRLEVVAQNLANIDTTRGVDGKPYQRKEVVFESVLDAAGKGEKVKVSEIKNDPRPMLQVYKPGHPDADKNGMVTMPNVNMVEEMADMMTATRTIDANLEILKASRRMVNNMIDVGTAR